MAELTLLLFGLIFILESAKVKNNSALHTQYSILGNRFAHD